MPAETTIPVTRDTFEAAKSAKRGGMTWEELMRAMLEQYNPEKPVG